MQSTKTIIIYEPCVSLKMALDVQDTSHTTLDALWNHVLIMNLRWTNIYRECILNIDWNALNVYEDCETYYKHFIDKFKNVYDHVIPITGVKKRYRNRLPWLTTGLKESIKHKNKLFKISRRHPTAHNKTVLRLSLQDHCSVENCWEAVLPRANYWEQE